ncbi:MAG: methylmalonyl Co-A mutase-associated GTPase MeaB, partial [Bacteroidota bacterium]
LRKMPEKSKSSSADDKSASSSFLSGRRRRKERPAEAYVEGILAGDRVVLGQAITLVESHLDRHRRLARQIIEACLPHTRSSTRIGITGTPGVGKSTFIENLGRQLLEQGHQLAVLAVDPSSQVSSGSILGDKTRMNTLSTDPRAFVRPSPAGRSLGGVARNTRETIMLCEAAGYDTIFIETVGVGQSEISVHSMVDFFLLLLLPGAGDELQGMKRGIVEMADGIIINKADGERRNLARQARKDYAKALHLFPAKENGLPVEIHLCSALEGEGIDQAWTAIQAHLSQLKESGFFAKRRQSQALYWLNESINARLRDTFNTHEAVRQSRAAIEQAILDGKLSPFEGGDRLLQLFFDPPSSP